MKVYTHYAEVDGTGFRWRTLLQFGNSWDIIGSVVMKNPGTAAPNNTVTDKNVLSKLSAFSDDTYDWYEFSAVIPGKIFAASPLRKNTRVASTPS